MSLKKNTIEGYELRKWLILKTHSVLKAQPIYENIKDWDSYLNPFIIYKEVEKC